MWTDQKIKSFKPAEKRYRVSDNIGQRGAGKLILDILPSGKKTFYYQYFKNENGKSKRILLKIGEYKYKASVPGISLADARTKAIKFSEKADGDDLKQILDEEEARKAAKIKQKNTAALTLEDVLEDYISSKDLKPGTILDYRKSMKQTFGRYLNRPITDITREIILKIYKERMKQSVARANNAMRVFRALYNYQRAVTRLDDGSYLMPENPVSILQETKVTRKIKRRQSYIPKELLPAWFDAVLSLDDSQFLSGTTIRDYLLFILFTGTRREEARQLKREDVDLIRKTFILKDTKNKEVVELPMSDYLADLIEKRLKSHSGKYVFNGLHPDTPFVSFKRPLAHLRQELNYDFTVHDLRRTFITIAESLDISIYTLKKLVNHKLSDAQDITAGYVMVDIDRIREASQKITNRVLEFAGK